MNRKLCLLFLVCLAVVLVKSESTIEVDENGDEYEVKRFNIQGRQLGSGRSQCVVTRRKRSSLPQPMYSNDGSDDDDEVDDKNDDGDTMKAEEQNPMLFYSPPTDNPTADEKDEDEDEEEGDGGDENTMNMNMEEMNMKDKEEDEEKEEDEMNDIKKDENDKDEDKEDKEDEDMNEEDNKDKEGDNEGDDEEEEEEEDEDDTIEVVQLPQLPILGQLQSEGESVAAIASASGVAQTEQHNPGHHGIMVVQSHTPPKVNPQTHAVFQLVPVNQDTGAPTQPAAQDGGADDNDDDFHFNEELSPVTTTAIWSTGDDTPSDLYNDYKPVSPVKVVKKTPRPSKIKKNKKKSPLKRKNKNKYSYKRRVSSGYKKRRSNKNRKRGNRRRVSVRRPVTRRKVYRGTTSVRGSSTQSKPSSQNANKKKSGNSYSNKKNRNSSAKNKYNYRKQNNKKHNEIIDQGVHTFTRTMTMTQTGDEDGDRNVNCIYIRKDPPSTTPRPFWGLLGRSADGKPIASGHFGKRKRVNVRFVA